MQQNRLIKNERGRDLMICALFTFGWGILAHTYGLSNGLFSHDSLNALVADRTEEIWKVQLGRFLVPAYRALVRPGLAMPWLIGMLGFAFIALTVYLVCDALRLRSNAARALVSGILTVNITVSALIATYNYEFDVDMLALLFAAGAFWLWQRHRWGFLPGALALALSLALYQAYSALTLSLCMSGLILRLLDGENVKTALRDAAKAVAMLLLGGLIYWLSLSLVCTVTGIQTDSEAANSLGQLKDVFHASFIKNVLKAWLYWFKKLVRFVPAYGKGTQIALHVLLLLACGFVLVRRALIRRLSRGAWAMAGALLMLLPLGMNAVYVLSGGMMHFLMVQPYCCVYLLGIALLFKDKNESARPERFPRRVAALLLGVLLLGNMISANAFYLKKDLEQQATLSCMTRAAERIESCPLYERGKTPVAVYGIYEQDVLDGFERYAVITGLRANSPISMPGRKETVDMYEAYFKYILNCNIAFCDLDAWERILFSEELAGMPAFPDADCIRLIDGVLVLKMSKDYLPDAGKETK